MHSQTLRSPASELAVRRYCHHCGGGLRRGRCQECDPARAERRWVRRGAKIAAVSLLVVVTVLAGVAISRNRGLEDRIARLEAAVEPALASDRALGGRLDAAAASAASLARRLSELESPATSPPGPSDVADTVRASVLTVEVGSGGGSAFVIRRDGPTAFLVTNYHVVEDIWDAGGRGVALHQGDVNFFGSIVRVNSALDLALLEVPADLPALKIAEAEPDPGDPVMVVGSPLGLEGSVTTGVVSSIREEEGVREIQFSAPVNPGNSGGPVVDSFGDVIGVAVSKFVGLEVEGVSFAIPAAVVCEELPGACQP